MKKFRTEAENFISNYNQFKVMVNNIDLYIEECITRETAQLNFSIRTIEHKITGIRRKMIEIN